MPEIVHRTQESFTQTIEQDGNKITFKIRSLPQRDRTRTASLQGLLFGLLVALLAFSLVWWR